MENKYNRQCPNCGSKSPFGLLHCRKCGYDFMIVLILEKVKEDKVKVKDLIKKERFEDAVKVLYKMESFVIKNNLSDFLDWIMRKLLYCNRLKIKDLMRKPQKKGEKKLLRFKEPLKQDIIKNLKERSLIKKTILDLGTKFARLQINEIVEECGEDESIIIDTVKEMIERDEIYAKYFESSKAILFNLQANVNKLKEVIVLPENKKICIVCRGDITQFFFECANCGSLHHINCAKALQEDDKGCFKCNILFPKLPEIPESEKEEPIILSIQKISNSLKVLLDPEEIQHKDSSEKFAQLKIELQNELKHKVSQQFFNGFGKQIEILFQKIAQLSANNLSELDIVKKEQNAIFKKINKKLKEFKPEVVKSWREEIFCSSCGKQVDRSQLVCEYCGEELKKY